MRRTLLRPLLRPARLRPPPLSRPASSATRPPAPPPRPRLEPTTFSAPAAPHAVHERPEALRGLPPSGVRAPWETPVRARSRPAPGTAAGAMEHDFAGPSRPRLVYERPRDLPLLRVGHVALAALGLGSWALFVLHATNNERLSSSVLRQVLFQLRNSPDVVALLGGSARLGDNWWGFGEPWISGGINLMQGRVDLKFRIQGARQGATVFFTSIRPQQAAAWRIVRYKLIADDGHVLRLEDKFTQPASLGAGLAAVGSAGAPAPAPAPTAAPR
ncbi:cytochrome oxidase assembly protein 1 [Cryptotrichosporon argae]